MKLSEEQIKKIENLVNQEILNLGLEPKYKINPDDIRIILEKDIFSSKQNNYDYLKNRISLYRLDDQALHIKLIRKVVSCVMKTLTTEEFAEMENFILKHEMVHSGSYKKYIVSKKEGEDTKVSKYRLGYHLSYQKDKMKKSLFGGFNEAIVDATTIDIVNNENKDSNKEMISRVSFSSYKFNLSLVDKIASKIAQVKGETKEDVWNRFKAGQFTGNMMHLRDVETVCGEGSLRVLAMMPTVVSKKNQKLFDLYFSTENTHTNV
jgi:hypothetical protein